MDVFRKAISFINHRGGFDFLSDELYLKLIYWQKMGKKFIGRKRMLNYMPRISMKAIKLFLLKEELKSNVDLFVDY